MCLTEYDEARTYAELREEALEEGKEEGKEEGTMSTTPAYRGGGLREREFLKSPKLTSLRATYRVFQISIG